MEKHIMGENGISYTLGEDGLYYPDLYLQRGDGISDWKVWNVTKDVFKRTSERNVFGTDTCRKIK